MSPRAKGVLGRALIVLIVLLVACASTVITAHAGAPPTSRLTSEGKFDYTERALALTPWWGHFNDPALDSLLQVGGAEAEAATGASVAAGYVKAKVLDYRLAAYREIVKVTDLELAGLTQSTGGPANAVQTMLLERRGESTRSAADLERSLDDCIGALAQRAHVSPTRLRTVVADDQLRGLPRFDMQVPARLPANIVRSRPDVERAEAVLLLGMARASRDKPPSLPAMFEGWIEPAASAVDPKSYLACDDVSPPDRSSSSATAARRTKVGPTAPSQVFDNSRAEVAVALGRLVAFDRSILRARRLLDVRHVELQAAEALRSMGASSELEVQERYVRLLFDVDGFARASGALAVAWTELSLRTGGCLPAVQSQGDSEGARSPQCLNRSTAAGSAADGNPRTGEAMGSAVAR